MCNSSRRCRRLDLGEEHLQFDADAASLWRWHHLDLSEERLPFDADVASYRRWRHLDLGEERLAFDTDIAEHLRSEPHRVKGDHQIRHKLIRQFDGQHLSRPRPIVPRDSRQITYDVVHGRLHRCPGGDEDHHAETQPDDDLTQPVYVRHDDDVGRRSRGFVHESVLKADPVTQRHARSDPQDEGRVASRRTPLVQGGVHQSEGEGE